MHLVKILLEISWFLSSHFFHLEMEGRDRGKTPKVSYTRRDPESVFKEKERSVLFFKNDGSTSKQGA
jgi:hypothetical protein